MKVECIQFIISQGDGECDIRVFFDLKKTDVNPLTGNWVNVYRASARYERSTTSATAPHNQEISDGESEFVDVTQQSALGVAIRFIAKDPEPAKNYR